MFQQRSPPRLMVEMKTEQTAPLYSKVVQKWASQITFRLEPQA